MIILLRLGKKFTNFILGHLLVRILSNVSERALNILGKSTIQALCCFPMIAGLISRLRQIIR